jgi:hypothetical protein
VPFTAFPPGAQLIFGSPVVDLVYVPSKRIKVFPGLSLGMAYVKVFHGEDGDIPEFEFAPFGDI